MKRSTYVTDRPLGAIVSGGSAVALLLSLLTLVLLNLAGEEGRQELARESERLATFGASQRLLSHLDLFLWTLSALCLLGLFKGIAIYRGTRLGFRFAIAVNVMAVFAFLPWINFEIPIRGILSLFTLIAVTGALVAYCALRLAGRIGPRPES